MTNGEKYKTAKERRKAFDKCRTKHNVIIDEFIWLEWEHAEELKPCPFCGNEASVGTTTDALAVGFVSCNSCNCHVIEATECEAISAWNRRV